MDTTTQLQQASSSSNTGGSDTDTAAADDDDDGASPSWKFRAVPAAAWLALVVFAFGLAPGELNDSNALLEKVLANPVHPGINEAFYTLFNVFAPLPVILACLVLPQGRRRKGLPAGPFVLGAAFLGFFTLGPYLALRAPPRTSVEQDEESISWVTRYVLENKLVNWSTLAVLLYLPWACQLLPVAAYDPATWTDL